jgi:hypothetical protein
MSGTRKRELVFRQGLFGSGFKFAGTTYPSSPISCKIVGKQETTSTDTFFPYFRRHARDHGSTGKIARFVLKNEDLGAPFYTTKNTYKDSNTLGDLRYYSSEGNGSSFVYYGEGPQFAWIANSGLSSWPSVVPSSNAQLDVIGTKFIARVNPVNPISGFAQFIGELHEGLPRVVGLESFRRRAFRAREAGSEYLNVEFGWKPFISDLQKFGHAVKNSKEILAQFERNSGKNVYRRVTDPPIETTTVSEIGTGLVPIPTCASPVFRPGGTGKLIKTEKTSVTRSFSGCFVYFLDAGESTRAKMHRHAQLAEKLFGYTPSVETIWELTPWSWGADWVVDIGDLLTNVRAFNTDGLVMRWGYVMEHTVSSITYDLSGVSYWNSAGPHSFHQTFTTEVKVRRKATPFGFGLNPDVDFTPRQLAIIAALGMSRGRGTHS